MHVSFPLACYLLLSELPLSSPRGERRSRSCMSLLFCQYKASPSPRLLPGLLVAYTVTAVLRLQAKLAGNQGAAAGPTDTVSRPTPVGIPWLLSTTAPLPCGYVWEGKRLGVFTLREKQCSHNRLLLRKTGAPAASCNHTYLKVVLSLTLATGTQ